MIKPLRIARIKGSALLTALFIMTIVAIIATAMTTRLQVDIYKTRLLINSDKMYLASQAVTFWAMDKLKEKDPAFQGFNKKGRLATFPAKLQSIYPDVHLSGELIDLQSKFNINTLNNKKFTASFLFLSGILLPESNIEERKTLTLAIQHWIGGYQPENGRDAYLSTYLKNKPPYYPGYQVMKSISELRLVHGVNNKIYQKLLPYVTALPEQNTPINVNRATKPVLNSLGNGLSEPQLTELLDARGKEGFKSMDELKKLLLKFSIAPEEVTLESHYFLSIAYVNSDAMQLTNYSILKKEKNIHTGKNTVILISEFLNSL